MTPGLYLDIPMDTYIADPCERPSLSAGVMHDLVYRTPAHARRNHPRLNPDCVRDESSRADLGSAIHSAILGGKPVEAVEYPDWRTKEARENRDRIRENGGIPVLGKDVLSVRAAALSAQLLLQTFSSEKLEWQREGTMIWEREGVLKRGRFDLWCEAIRTMVDIKTCASANPASWIRSSLVSGGYDIQSEHYLEGIQSTLKLDHQPTFLFLLVEIEAPYAASLVGLDPAFADFARRKIAYACERWKSCLQNDIWPGYPIFPHWAELAPWQEADLEMKFAYTKEATS